ncbi:hypothetical protein TNIN_431071 [Trichonephila inaurata madagascariensis]|uniref:Uncharacterized protein n=1 Tax=Trichonephila inaurata madagascariensis TaxID=2747483 RepID=A0A8X6YN33_9ARAC|nr:hypothetical protein TNIN_431071 [Trichonephila inaurata madagascariensis]
MMRFESLKCYIFMNSYICSHKAAQRAWAFASQREKICVDDLTDASENSMTASTYRQDARGAPNEVSVHSETGTPCMQYQTRLSQSVSSDIKLENLPKIF